MATKNWVFDIENQRHKVEIDWSQLSGGGKILVDGRIIDTWRGGLMQLPPEKHFEVEGKPAVLRRKGRIFEALELYLEGKLIP